MWTKKKKYICRAVAILLSVLLAGGVAVLPGGAADGGLSWYCKRAADHAQPMADSTLSFVESCPGYYIDHRHTDPAAEDKVVYLTFDVGYENGYVARILDILRETDTTGAFFILGHVAEANGDLVRRMAAEGHLVCNHTDSHRCLVGATAQDIGGELENLERRCASLGVSVAPFFRPPEGRFDRALLEEVARRGYTTVFWSFAYADWDNNRQPDPGFAKKKILDNLHNGAVILLHPTSETNAAILGQVITEMKAQGYRFGNLEELTDAVPHGEV